MQYVMKLRKQSFVDCVSLCFSTLLQECETDVLIFVLQSIEGLLQDRTLTLSAMSDLSPLCQLLYRLTSRAPAPASSSSGPTPVSAPSSSTTLQQQLQQPLKQRQSAVTCPWPDVSVYVYPVLATLASYPTHLDRKAQVDTYTCTLV